MKIESGAIPGFYIAWNPWFQVESPGRLHKVGHTGDLRRRLCDSAYVTCFPPDSFRYEATFETATKEDAYALEQAVLYYYRDARLSATSELVRGPTAAELAERAAAIAAALGLASLVRRDLPVYERPQTEARATEAVSAETPERKDWRQLVDEMRPPVLDNEFLDEILSWDYSALAITPPQQVESAAPASIEVAVVTKRTKRSKRKLLVEPALKEEELMFDNIDDGSLEVEIDSPYANAPWAGLRDYQHDAVEKCSAELATNGRAILQMACRCGKTPVAYEVIKTRLAASQDKKTALFLVPSLSLLRQTAQKIISYGYTGQILLVGSDSRPVPLGGGRAPLVMTTDAEDVEHFLTTGGPMVNKLVVCMYQSSQQVPVDAFVITVFDEAHRICGGKASRPFNYILKSPRHGERLFMTATPSYDGDISMKNRNLFGGIAYRYHLRQGIDAEFVNPFKLILLATPSTNSTSGDLVTPDQIIAAMSTVDKLLIFCRDIAQVTRLCEATRKRLKELKKEEFECALVHSKMKHSAVETIHRFGEKGRRMALFNCKILQEGVEVPELNAVLFATPRHAPRDIIQSLCRPLNRTDGKPISIVFIPVQVDPSKDANDPENLKRFASVVPFVDALADEDPRLYDHLLDPEGAPYPVDILGTHSLGLTDESKRQALLAAAKRAIRYRVNEKGVAVDRMYNVTKLPWEKVFRELKRTVEVCRRYPKQNDAWFYGGVKQNFHSVYCWLRKQYTAWNEGRTSTLEPHQIADLKTLPYWDRYGAKGPYPFPECMQTLDRLLEENGGDFRRLLFSLSKCGFIGFSATAIERLSGALTIVNQSDGRKVSKKGKVGKGYKLSKDREDELRRVAEKWGLKWKKDRDETGELIEGAPPTFYTEAKTAFGKYLAEHGPDDPLIQEQYPNFPLKHMHMEEIDVIEQGLAPPRMKEKKRRVVDEEPEDESDDEEDIE